MPAASNRSRTVQSCNALSFALLAVLFAVLSLRGKRSHAKVQPPAQLTFVIRIEVSEAVLRAVSWSRFTREFLCLDANCKVTAIHLDGSKRLLGTDFEVARLMAVSPDGNGIAGWSLARSRLSGLPS